MFSNSYNKKIQDEIKAVNERFILHQNRTGREAYGSGYSMIQLKRKPVLNMVHKKQYGGGFFDEILDGISGAVDFLEKGSKVKKIISGKGMGQYDDMDDVDLDYDAQSGGKKYTRRVGRGMVEDLIEAEAGGRRVGRPCSHKRGGVFSGGVYSGGVYVGGASTGGASTGGKRKAGRPRKGGKYKGAVPVLSANDVAAIKYQDAPENLNLGPDRRINSYVDPSLKAGSPEYYQALYQQQQKDYAKQDASDTVQRNKDISAAEQAQYLVNKKAYDDAHPSEWQKMKMGFKQAFGIIPKIAKIGSFVAPLAGLGKKGVKGKKAKKGVESAWIKHVKKVQAQKGCSYKDAMTMAKKTYKK